MKKNIAIGKWDNLVTDIYCDTLKSYCDKHKDNMIFCSQQIIPIIKINLDELVNKKITKVIFKSKYLDNNRIKKIKLYPVLHDFMPGEVSMKYCHDNQYWEAKKWATDYFMYHESVFSKEVEVYYDEVNLEMYFEIPIEIIRLLKINEAYGIAFVDVLSDKYKIDSETKEVSTLKKRFGEPILCEVIYECGDFNDVNNHDICLRNDKLEFGNSNIYFLDDFIKVEAVSGNVIGTDENISSAYQKNNLFNGDEVFLEALIGERLGFKILIENLNGKLDDMVIEVDDVNVELRKSHYVLKDDSYTEDALIPIEAKGYNQNILNQKFLSYYVNFNINDSATDEKIFSVVIRNGEKEKKINVIVKVYPVSLNKSSFGYHLNGYCEVGKNEGYKREDERYLKIEEAYYKKANDLEMNIDIVPYMQDGSIHVGYAPEVLNIDGELKFDFSKYDKRFGKYFKSPYKISSFMLPIHENWPIGIDRALKISVCDKEYPKDINYIRNYSININDLFKEEYKQGYEKFLDAFLEYLNENEYYDTKFVFYLNNKHYYKNKANSKLWIDGVCKGGSSYWCLDEPILNDDFDALDYYANILKEYKDNKLSKVPYQFRIDISREHLMPAKLREDTDVMCLNRKIFSLRKKELRAWLENNKEIWVYGHLNDINEPNTSAALNVIDLYLSGADAFLPWNNYGDLEAYSNPQITASFYPSSVFSLDEPVVSIRLESANRGLQFCKYFDYLLENNVDEEKLKNIVFDFLPLDALVNMEDEDDAGKSQYKNIHGVVFRKLKHRLIIEALNTQINKERRI